MCIQRGAKNIYILYHSDIDFMLIVKNSRQRNGPNSPLVFNIEVFLVQAEGPSIPYYTQIISSVFIKHN